MAALQNFLAAHVGQNQCGNRAGPHRVHILVQPNGLIPYLRKIGNRGRYEAQISAVDLALIKRYPRNSCKTNARLPGAAMGE